MALKADDPNETEPAVTSVDESLVRLRRLWSPGRSSTVDDRGGPVEMSSLLVVEAVARHCESGAQQAAGVRDVAAFCDVEPSTASRLVDRAVRAGLVDRAPSRADSRRAALTVTPEGAAMRERAARARTGWLAQVLSGWKPEEVIAFAGALARFASDVEKDPPHRS